MQPDGDRRPRLGAGEAMGLAVGVDDSQVADPDQPAKEIRGKHGPNLVTPVVPEAFGACAVAS